MKQTFIHYVEFALRTICESLNKRTERGKNRQNVDCYNDCTRWIKRKSITFHEINFQLLFFGIKIKKCGKIGEPEFKRNANK